MFVWWFIKGAAFLSGCESCEKGTCSKSLFIRIFNLMILYNLIDNNLFVENLAYFVKNLQNLFQSYLSGISRSFLNYF